MSQNALRLLRQVAAGERHLGEKEPRIVLLRVIADIKYRKIAVLLELPLATALSKYRRALNMRFKAQPQNKTLFNSKWVIWQV